MINQFAQNFVKPGLVPIKLGKSLSTLYEKRISGTYDVLIEFDEEGARISIEEATQFVNFGATYLRESGFVTLK